MQVLRSAATVLRWGVQGLVAVAVATSCVAYDSRWFEQQAEQRRYAERLHPATLSARGPGGGASVFRARVRAYATKAYSAETVDWEKRFRDLLADASAVLEPSLSVVLEDAGTALFEPPSGASRLESALSELSRLDPGNDADWVVGFVESTPKLVANFHELGVGATLSKHFVVRASNNPAEYAALTSTLTWLDDAAKAKVYSQRKRHRMVAVFLHEFGHTLGAWHRQEGHTLMNPVYDPREERFDDATLGLLRVTLKSRAAGGPTPYPELLRYMKAHPDGWVESERVEFVQDLEDAAHPASEPATPAAAAAPSATPLPATAALAAPAPEPASTALALDTLPPADRERYESARRSETAGDTQAAWRTAQPLFEAHPRVLEVQELRCRLAKGQRIHALVVAVHCEHANALRR